MGIEVVSASVKNILAWKNIAPMSMKVVYKNLSFPCYPQVTLLPKFIHLRGLLTHK